MNIYACIHSLGILILIIVPFYPLSVNSLLLYLIFSILVVMHWKINDGECYMTTLEKRKYPENYKIANQGFIGSFLGRVGINWKNDITEIILLTLILFVILRLYFNLFIIY